MKKLVFPVLLFAGATAASLGCGCANDTPSEEVLAAATETATLKVEGMTCASCKVTVRTAARKVDGVAKVDVDVDAGTATVTYDPRRTDPKAIAEAITGAGYRATPAAGA